jgi:hypothetical protein
MLVSNLQPKPDTVHSSGRAHEAAQKSKIISESAGFKLFFCLRFPKNHYDCSPEFNDHPQPDSQFPGNLSLTTGL